jgi:hypothetical protein
VGSGDTRWLRRDLDEVVPFRRLVAGTGRIGHWTVVTNEIRWFRRHLREVCPTPQQGD